MSELEKRDEAEAEVAEVAAQQPSGAVSKLAQWAQDARSAHLIAQSLSGTEFVSKEFRGRPDLVTAAILTGQEIGLEPMASLRSIDIIQGTPAMRAHALRALVQNAGHEIWLEESTETRAIVKGRRAGSSHVQTSVWTIDRAQKLGIANREQWRRQPQAMLVARATAEVCRLIASDVLLGMPYAVEELEESGASESKPRRARRKQVEKPKPAEPDLESPTVADADEAEPTAPEPEGGDGDE